MMVVRLDGVATDCAHGEADVLEKNFKSKTDFFSTRRPYRFIKNADLIYSLPCSNPVNGFPALLTPPKFPQNLPKSLAMVNPLSPHNALSSAPGLSSSVSKPQLQSPCLPVSDVTLSALPTSVQTP